FAGSQILHVGIGSETTRLRHSVHRQSGHLGDTFIKRLGGLTLGWCASQCHQIVRHCKIFRGGERFRTEDVLALEFGGGQRWQLQRGPQCRLVISKREPAFQEREPKENAENKNSLALLQSARLFKGEKTAIALAKKKFRRGGAIALGKVECDCLGHRTGIAAYAPEILSVVRFDRAA